MCTEYEDEISDEKHLFNAMEAAKAAFFKYFEKEGYDGAYWELELTGYVLDSEFKRHKKLTMSETIDDA